MSDYAIALVLLGLALLLLGLSLRLFRRPRSMIVTKPPEKVQPPKPLLVNPKPHTLEIDWQSRYYEMQNRNIELIAQMRRMEEGEKASMICDLCGQSTLDGSECRAGFEEKSGEEYNVHVKCFTNMTMENILYVPIKASKVGLLLALARADQCFQYNHVEEVCVHDSEGDPFPVCRFCRQEP